MTRLYRPRALLKDIERDVWRARRSRERQGHLVGGEHIAAAKILVPPRPYIGAERMIEGGCAGLQGRAGRTAYAASKYGMRGFTEALRDETKTDNIRIGAVFQSGTNTQMFAKAGEEMPTDKYSEPGDLADIVVFMLTRPPKIWINELHVVY